MAIPTITEQEFVAEVLESEIPVLVEFGANWCGPCKLVAPELALLADELRGKLSVVTVDVDKSPNIARELGVQAVPTFVLFVNGRPVTAKSGAQKRAQLRDMLEPFLPRQVGALKPEEAATLLSRRRIQLVDTREPVVYNRVHLPGAVNFPLAELETRLAELHMLPSTPVLYCRNGDETKDLAARMAQQGVPVSFLEGGVLAWEAKGLPVERP